MGASRREIRSRVAGVVFLLCCCEHEQRRLDLILQCSVAPGGAARAVGDRPCGRRDRAVRGGVRLHLRRRRHRRRPRHPAGGDAERGAVLRGVAVCARRRACRRRPGRGGAVRGAAARVPQRLLRPAPHPDPAPAGPEAAADRPVRDRRDDRDDRRAADAARGSLRLLDDRPGLFALWNLGTLAGALVGGGINTSAFGLDAAAPAIFLALLWPQLSRARARAVALGAVVVTLSLITIAPAGVPIIAAAGVAVVAGLLPARGRRRRAPRMRAGAVPGRSE